MKSFNTYLTEDKDRFIKKNVNLTRDQKDEVMKFFKTNRQAEGKVDWQKSKNMTYDNFVDIMIKSRSGRKVVLKHKAIKGSQEGTDYVQMRMPSKEYLGYIPLNWETAKKFNTKEMGVCQGEWCIGGTESPYHWNDEVITDQQVPIYVINRSSKWVVMIKEGNSKYDVWNIDNDPRKTHEGIPDFSIRKNLLSGKQKSMYDELREDYFSDEEEIPEIDVDDAIIDYDQLVSDIEDAVGQYEQASDDARDNWNNECDQIKRDTKEEYEEALEAAEEEWNDASTLYDDLDVAFDELESEINDWDEEDGEDEPTGSIGFATDLSLDDLESKRDEAETIRDNAEEEVNKIQEKLDRIDNIENYEMEDTDIEWSEDPPSEDGMYEDIDVEYPSISDGAYSDYIDIMEEHANFNSYHSDVDSDIISYCDGNSRASSAGEVLSNHELFHPDWINDRNN